MASHRIFKFFNFHFTFSAFNFLEALTFAYFFFRRRKAEHGIGEKRRENQSSREPLLKTQRIAKVQHREHDIEELSDGQHNATRHDSVACYHFACEQLPTTANYQDQADVDNNLRMPFAKLHKVHKLAADSDSGDQEQRTPRVHEQHEVERRRPRDRSHFLLHTSRAAVHKETDADESVT